MVWKKKGTTKKKYWTRQKTRVQINDWKVLLRVKIESRTKDQQCIHSWCSWDMAMYGNFKSTSYTRVCDRWSTQTSCTQAGTSTSLQNTGRVRSTGILTSQKLHTWMWSHTPIHVSSQHPERNQLSLKWKCDASWGLTASPSLKKKILFGTPILTRISEILTWQKKKKRAFPFRFLITNIF